MRYFVNVNPFEKGFQDYRIERLAMIYTQDLPWTLHYAPIHPCQQYLKDVEFENQHAIFSDHYAFLENDSATQDILATCKYQGQFIKIVYRINASYGMGETIIGQPITLDEAQNIVQKLQFETGTFSRCWEISNRHIPKTDFDLLLNDAKQLPQIVASPFLMDLFILDDQDDFSLGIRLNRTPWTDEHLTKVTDYNTASLRQSYLADGDLSAAFVDLIMLAGQADVRIVIFKTQGKVLEHLPIYCHD